MPFLRPVAPSSDHGDAAIELKSSKTLIGAGASTCDVVLPDVNGVLEVHALLSLSPTKSSGSLVPFSTVAGGSCFLNGQQIPQDGARVVHGDRLAFGVGPDANEFIFELTGKWSTGNSSSTLRRSSTRDFRKALDALRGDRESSQRQRMARDLSAASLASISPDKAKKRTGVGQSREEQFSKLLAGASSDSALSDYVERKLRERQLKSTTSITDSELNGGRAMMEPPPSLLSSMTESMGSRAGTSFKDSILERSVDALKDKSLTSTSAFTSTAEKNYAEIEKLRLSQRMRQVNRVLNGSMTFGDSYMATDSDVNASRGHDVDDHVLARSPNLTSITRDQPRQTSRSMQQASAEEEEEHSDNEEDDELPAMSEKPTPPTALSPQHVSATELQELSNRNYQVQGQDQEHEEVDQEESLADSLPGFSEPIRATPPKSPQQNTHSFRASTVTAKATPSGSPLKIDAAAAVPPTKTRTALHQKLIDQAISQRQLDTLAQGFVRWKRGLRIQTQRRLHKAQQLRKLSDRLGILRRNRAFSEWQSLASIQSQIVSCRIEAFQSRSGSRLVYSAFTRWIRATLIGGRAKRVMHAILSRALLRHIGKSFRTWRENSLFVGQASSEDRLRLYYDVHIESRLNHSAAKHCSRVEQEKLRRVLRGWFQAAKEEIRMATRLVHAARCHFERTCREQLRRHLKGWQSVTSKQRRKLSILSRLIRRQAGGQLRRALAIWKVGCLLRRSEQSLQHQAEKLKAKADLELEELDKEHQSAKRDIEGELTRQLDELKGKLQQKETALVEAQSRIEERRQQKMHALEEWTYDLEGFYEKSITNCDAQIEEASAQLEQLLQMSDSNVVAARFRASQYLVATMTEQKASQANARAALQEAFIASLSKGRSSLLEDIEDDVQVSKGVQILQSLLQQRVTRRLQLHRSIARVAAAAPPSKATANSQPVDATRLKHASFLAAAVAEREAQHAAAMTRLLLRVRRAHPPPAAQY